MAGLNTRVATLLLVALLCSVTAALAAAQTYRFDIQSQPLGEALHAFSDQSGLQIVYHTELLPDAAANPVRGTYDAETALNRLLRGTAVEARAINSHTYAIAPHPATDDGARRS